MVGRWEVGTMPTCYGDMYVIYRLKYKDGPDDEFNREYYGSKKYMFMFEEYAKKIAGKLNGDVK